MNSQAILSEIWVYPVKSFAGVSLRQSLLTETGLEWDRCWMVVDAQGHMVSQRDIPTMALITPRFRAGDVVLRAPGMLALHLALDIVQRLLRIRQQSACALDHHLPNRRRAHLPALARQQRRTHATLQLGNVQADRGRCQVQGLGSGTVTLGIHIAAPGLAITPDAALDKVARDRLSTVYMPGWKLTMLPEAVVQAYTLDEGRDCPAVSLYVTLDEATLAVKKSETRLERVPIAANLRHDQLDEVITEATLTGEAVADYPFAAELAFCFRLARQLKAARETLGEDFWSYGAHENKHPLETLARYSFEQGLSVRQVPFEEMFAKSTYELTKI